MQSLKCKLAKRIVDENDWELLIILAPQLTYLEWFNPPQSTVMAGEKFATFSVAADEGLTKRIQLEEKRN